MRALNLQPVEKVETKSGWLRVVKVFPTIQGEGPFAGMPAVFVRLAGCNLQCPMCDTDYTSNWVECTREAILDSINKVRTAVPRSKLIVITGGEPFRQNIGPLLAMLIGNEYTVQIETNGTLFQDGAEDWLSMKNSVHVVCSPKTPRVNHQLAKVIGTYKYVLSAGAIDAKDGLPTSVMGLVSPPARPHFGFKGPVYVQPCDDLDPAKNKANLDATIASTMKFGYRLSIQLHKIGGLE